MRWGWGCWWYGQGQLQIMLDRGKNADWFGSGFIVALAVIALIGLCAFLWWELTEEQPIIDLSLFRQRNFRPGHTGLLPGQQRLSRPTC